MDPASWAEAEHAVGAAWTLNVDGSVKHRGAWGCVRADADTPYTVATLQNIASVSKTVTATAAMQLVEKGVLGLDTDINACLPFPVRHPMHPDVKVTLRMLLSHQSAVRDGIAYAKSYACGDPSQSLEVWLRSLFEEGGAHAEETQFHSYAPGTQHRYSNVAYGIIGHLVECISGSPFYDYCRDAIFNPLGMKSTGWMLSEIDTSNHATPHAHLKRIPRRKKGGDRDLVTVWPQKEPGFAQFCLYAFPNYPDGLLRTNVADFGEFLNAFANNGGTLLKPATLQQMLHPQCEASDEPGHFQALCWVGKKDTTGRTVYKHSGSDPGVATLAVFRPEDRTSACAFANAETSLPFRIVEQLLA